MNDDPHPLDRLCGLDNAIDRERRRREWEQRAPMMAMYGLVALVVLCEVMRGW